MKKYFFIPLLTMLLAWPTPATGKALAGDIDKNGRIDIADVTMLIDYLLSSEETVEMAVCDLDGNGNVGIEDVTMLIDMLLNPAPPQTDSETITVNGVQFTMVRVEAGTFMMGARADETAYASRNEFPSHEVTLTYDYYIAQTEVTWELYLAVTEGDPASFEGDLTAPVTNVNLFDCAKFVDKLTELTGHVFRMPTEAEWEFAARGGNSSLGYLFAGSDDIDEVAWYVDNAAGNMQPVATKAPNELGLYDMSGNAMEWCQDWYVSYSSEPQINPIGPESGLTNVYRGGSAESPAMGCRITVRGSLDPHERWAAMGFRIVMNCE